MDTTRTITASSPVPFGQFEKGKPLGRCSTKYLEWMVSHLFDSDLHAWALAARGVLAKRKLGAQDCQAEDNLDQQADEFLKRHGYGQLARRKRRC